ncbi:DUF6923 family protein [Leifsonia soli]|uniref:Putative repeat protein (TIGR01451 family) n=1 Tax=Leifsonia soli TaxID=582665 RepID=A0A852T269_9MICO|nr:putative repeat protein (TIGR01451 family) [Leifsonia soli]
MTSGTATVTADAVPTWAPSVIGNQAYAGTPGKPAIHIFGAGVVTTTLRSITVKDPTGVAVKGYGLVSADAEATGSDERITWTSDTTVTKLADIHPAPGPGPENGCQMNPGGFGTGTATCTGLLPTADSRWGSLVVQSVGATTFSATMTAAGGGEAVALGFMTSKLTLSKTVAGRVHPSDRFDTFITSPEQSTLGQATTGTSNSSTTGAVTILPVTGSYTLSEAAGNETTSLGSYTQSWTCTNANSGSATVLPSGSGTSKTVVPAVGDDISCTITNTPPPPVWTCSAFGYLFQSPSDGVHQIYQVDLVSGAATQIGTTPDTVNGIGYNTLDNYMYGWDITTQTLVRIASDGTLTNLGQPAGASAPSGYQVGDFDNAGHLFLQYGGTGDGQWVEIDLAPGSANYGKVIASGTPTRPAGIANLPSDWTYVNGGFYGLADTTAGTGGAHLLRFDATTHAYTDLGPIANTSASATYGAAYADAAGNLYFSDNGSGTIYRVKPTTLESIVVSAGPSSVGNDGARCATAPIPTITVTKTVNGRVQPADQFTVGLNNGGGPALTSATTTGTNTTASTTNWPVSQNATYTITDVMAPGSPDALTSYSPTVVCTDSAGNKLTTGGSTAAWTFTVPGADAYICNVTNTPNTPSFTVSKSASSTSVAAGGVLTYTVTVTNTGTVPFTAANPASFTDSLVGVTDDAAYNGDASNGATVTGNTLSWSGPLAVGATQTITYSVTVRTPDNGNHILTNQVTPGTNGTCVTAGDCTTNTPVRSFHVTKTADRNQVVPGDTITYTVTVVNDGQVDYTAGTPASWSDDLTAVLDDATYNGDVTGGATYAAPTLSWSGPLAIGATATFTYSVTVNTPDTGDQKLTNSVVTPVEGGCPAGSTDPACTVTIPSGSYTVAKSASTTLAKPGDTVTYTVTVTNTGNIDYTPAAPAAFTDDLSSVLDDATYNGDASNGATVTGTHLTWSGPLPIGQSITITYSVTVNSPDTGDKVVKNTVRPTEPGGACATAGGCTTTTQVQSFTVAKASSPSGAVHEGDVVTYTVTVTNTGTGAFTAADPASFTDDLTKVLDDASYNGDAGNGAVVNGNTLSWSGALAVGATQTITYSVTVNKPDTGNKVLTNAVVPGDGGDCATAGSCTTTNDVQSFTVSKTSSPTGAVKPGDVITYTVTVKNTGTATYTAGAPASFTDDLSKVLDDATYNNDANNGAAYAAPTLSWSGPLAVGATTTVTYSVTVGAPASGDGSLTNAVTTPPNTGGGCDPEGSCSVTNPVQAFTALKTSSSTQAVPGDVVTYTITVANVGQVAYTAVNPAAVSDNLTGVLDDATYNGDASNGATYTAPTLAWALAIPVGGSVTLTYSVTVNTPDTGDHSLKNTVILPPDGGCAIPGGCETTTPVKSFSTAKSADTNAVIPGGKVTYTITVTNTGQVDYTAANPAVWTDDLTQVLDDATYNGDATGGATYAAPTLSWSGPLAIGASLTFTYSVTVNNPDAGDKKLHNAVVTPPGIGGDCEAGSTNPSCTVDVPSGSYTVAKTADKADVAPGDTVTYTVTVKNTGDVSYTAAKPASFTDDLSSVLDDATYNGDATNGATFSNPNLKWSGPLAVGATITVTYSVTVNTPDAGDKAVINTVRPTGGGGSCDPAAACSTTTNVQSFTVSKASSATSAKPGDVITYTITVTNTGKAAFTAAKPAAFTDDLSHVLDDAAYNGDASNGGSYTAPKLAWALALPVGQTVTVTYSITVTNPDTGDHELKNVVVPGNGGECDPAASCTTNDPVEGFTVRKTVDQANAQPGATVRYTITVSNTGKVDYTATHPASFTDDLSEVLDDAVYNGDASGGATYVKPVLSWSGPLPVGATTTITYSVKVNAPDTGDKKLVNAVVTSDGGNCVAGAGGAGCSVTTTVADPPAAVLAHTGSTFALPAAIIGALLALGGVALAFFGRRRRTVTGKH